VTSSASALLRDPGGSQRVTLLELFFDLVFVGALAVGSTTLAGRIGWLGAIHTVIPLIAIWWVWNITAIVTDFYDPQRPPIQILIGTVMVGTIMLAISTPAAFDGHAKLFAGSYVAIHILRGILLVSVLRGHTAQRRAARFMFWFAVSAIPWLTGAFLGQTAQLALWLLAIAIDLVSAGVRFPTPFLGRVPLEQYDRAREHIGERHQQFIILALGDVILVATLGGSRQQQFSAAGTGAILLAFVTTLLLWQIYVQRAGNSLLAFVLRRPGRVIRWAPYTHMVMVIGTVFTAAGFEVVINEPLGDPPTGWLGLIIGGPVLFLLGRHTFEYQVYGRAAWSRLLWPALMLAGSPAMAWVSPLVVPGYVAALLLGLAITDTVYIRRHRPPSTIHLVGVDDVG
jgi:low temperature requirement protein LtrA